MMMNDWKKDILSFVSCVKRADFKSDVLFIQVLQTHSICGLSSNTTNVWNLNLLPETYKTSWSHKLLGDL